MTTSKIMSANPPIESERQREATASLMIPSTTSLEIHISQETSGGESIPTPIYEMMILQARRERPSGPLFAERSSLTEVKSTSDSVGLLPTSHDIPRITIEVFDSDGRRHPIEETTQDLKGTETND